ncbi:gem-associated protein 2-like [Uloborus diversus]|uniref:gem-associated protein 2-like n=1 Tax=Uloborus diversus TaxID=327109 RepID=UPI0024095A1F|nr:gem-associated protein 2-like [Uloborus diversus]
MPLKKLEKMNGVEIKEVLKRIASLDKDFFLHYSKQIHQHRFALERKFPCSETKRHVLPDIISESNSCAFCLGIIICRKIYPEVTIAEDLHHSHRPRISIVIHLSQYDIHILLTYILKWYQIIGLTESLARWMFALLICLKEPVTNKTSEFLSSLSQKFKTDQNSKTGAELVRLCYLVKCINSLFNLNRQKDIKRLMQYAKLAGEMLSESD